jgi:hypothetical protein
MKKVVLTAFGTFGAVALIGATLLGQATTPAPMTPIPTDALLVRVAAYYRTYENAEWAKTWGFLAASAREGTTKAEYVKGLSAVQSVTVKSASKITSLEPTGAEHRLMCTVVTRLDVRIGNGPVLMDHTTLWIQQQDGWFLVHTRSHELPRKVYTNTDLSPSTLAFSAQNEIRLSAEDAYWKARMKPLADKATWDHAQGALVDQELTGVLAQRSPNPFTMARLTNDLKAWNLKLTDDTAAITALQTEARLTGYYGWPK